MQKTEPRQPAAPGESKLHFLDYWRVIRVRFGIVLLSFLLVVITAGVTTYFPAAQVPGVGDAGTAYWAEVQRVQAGSERGMGANDQRFIPTQTEILRSREVLNPVIDSQDLQRKWSADGAPISKETLTTGWRAWCSSSRCAAPT